MEPMTWADMWTSLRELGYTPAEADLALMEADQHGCHAIPGGDCIICCQPHVPDWPASGQYQEVPQ